eukprot:CAMPEP_0182498310 /NCGR_PEP_ID=MMETSP1321-20130603/6544_1 /TAXON_ID=91990 /ORGANISM="Bolidomonas sp., Strain RCC1657" /LENGTH=58 /DNA_ID=CAMNT_0024702349 /DNA_START=1188 /DNA_END=1362 /DNA_ORIENTATION=+
MVGGNGSVIVMYFPDVQSVQLVEAVDEYVPKGQIKQNDSPEDLGEELYFPAVHDVQVE